MVLNPRKKKIFLKKYQLLGHIFGNIRNNMVEKFDHKKCPYPITAPLSSFVWALVTYI